MFDVGFSELLVVAALGLLLIGPEKLPTVARRVGLYVRKFSRAWGQVRSEIERELEMEELKQNLESDKLKQQTETMQQEIELHLDDAFAPSRQAAEEVLDDRPIVDNEQK